ncbi:uncharacterized protein LOC113774863 isoform X2 [Coffea eugenioides]|uniref:uncharacterized protein LOC113774863 isoform X2 n=1 Tax=Coffea eugenioides TaxID=49369 RepID=UPI000F60C629|nr:uncharacterized protein LOC113774863 isoform X2 [Coffea eugenioides]
MAKSRSNEAILVLLRHGLAEFELTSSPVPSVTGYRPHKSPLASISVPATSHRFFARIGPSFGGGSPALKKVERYSVQKVTGDGRCLFRALVKGMAFNKGIALSPREEKENADELRMAVKEVICDNDKERLHYEEAMIAITVEESLKRLGDPIYCLSQLLPTNWKIGFLGRRVRAAGVVKAVLPANCCLHTRT